MAGIVALLNQANGQPVGFLNPQIYALGGSNEGEGDHDHAPFHDITSGENSDTAGLFGLDGFNAVPGYDMATGWGTPNVAVFIQLLSQNGQ